MTSNLQNEKKRLAALRLYQILDTEAEPEIDEITGLASEICQVPMVMVSFIEEEREWVKSSVKFPISEWSRKTALNTQAILCPFDPFIVSDMGRDERFKDHPFVKEDPHIVFFTAIPLTNPDGFTLGALCVMDKKSRLLSDSRIKTLQILARQIIHLLELRKANLRVELLKSDLEKQNEELKQFAYTVSHDIKSPLASIALTTEMLREHFGEHIDEDNDQLLGVLSRSSLKIRNLAEGMQAYYRSESALSENAESFDLRPFLSSITELFKSNQAIHIQISENDRFIYANKTALEQILFNLIQNAFKFNDKAKPIVEIRFSEYDTHYHFAVADNGTRMSSEKQKEIVELFTTPDRRDRFGTQGSGIGLSTVKRLVERLSGTINLIPTAGEGSEFSFTIGKQK